MATPRVVLVDHYDSYTWNLAHLLAAVTGRLPDLVEHDRVAAADLAGHSHVVLSAGPGRPDDRADFALGPAVFWLGLPVLGVCLGMQALVVAFGGAVEEAAPAHGEVAEIAHDDQGVFSGVPAAFRAVRYHSLQAVALPGCLEVSATCRDGGRGRRAVMGVRHRSLPLEGVQFHPESVLSEHGELLVRNFLGRG